MGQKVVVKRTPKLSIPQIPEELIQKVADWVLSDEPMTQAETAEMNKMSAAIAVSAARSVNLLIASSGGKTLEIEND